jgi:hypothetical protein
MNKINVVLLTYWKEREGNIEVILDAFEKEKDKIDELIVFNNNPEINIRKRSWVEVVNSSKNYGFMPRYAMAAMLDYKKHCLFADEDLVIREKTVDNFMKWGDTYPEAVLGYVGKKLKEDTIQPYTDGQTYFANQIKEPISIDIAVGRIHFCKASKVAQAFSILEKDLDYPRVEDDILLSLANKYYGFDNYVIPATEEEYFSELSDGGVGDCQKMNHTDFRNGCSERLVRLRNEK